MDDVGTSIEFNWKESYWLGWRRPPMRSCEACAPGTQLCRRCSSGWNWSLALGLFPWISTFTVRLWPLCLTSNFYHDPIWTPLPNHLFQSSKKACLTAAVRRCRRWWCSPSTWSSGSLAFLFWPSWFSAQVPSKPNPRECLAVWECQHPHWGTHYWWLGFHWLLQKVQLNNMTSMTIGFDEYMNLVLDDACEVHLKRKTEKVLF